MIDIKRYNGVEEFNNLLKSLPVVPSNTEIVEKTGVSKGSVSEIMNGIRPPSKKFIEKFKKGFKIDPDIIVKIEKEKTPSNDSGLKDKLINLYESSLKRAEDELQRVSNELQKALEENERLKKR
jgi:transcriptional regulator with XRE-family HTH domain